MHWCSSLRPLVPIRKRTEARVYHTHSHTAQVASIRLTLLAPYFSYRLLQTVTEECSIIKCYQHLASHSHCAATCHGNWLRQNSRNAAANVSDSPTVVALVSSFLSTSPENPKMHTRSENSLSASLLPIYSSFSGLILSVVLEKNCRLERLVFKFV